MSSSTVLNLKKSYKVDLGQGRSVLISQTSATKENRVALSLLFIPKVDRFMSVVPEQGASDVAVILTDINPHEVHLHWATNDEAGWTEDVMKSVELECISLYADMKEGLVVLETNRCLIPDLVAPNSVFEAFARGEPYVILDAKEVKLNQ
jgi:hypothetical protein